MNTVLVVGSSGGIGAATTAALGRAGHRVVGADKTPPTDAGCLDRFVEFDVTGPVDADILVPPEQELHALVYAAGVYPQIPFSKYTPAAWDEVFEVNVRGAFQVVHALHDRMAAGGRIVVVASGAAHIGSRDVAYASSKAALLGLVRSLAMNLGSRGILVNAVSPGVVETPMSARMPPDRKRTHVDRTALARIGTPEEVAAAVAFLLDAGTGYITGTSLDVNGGMYLR